ncbi:hypothetical protein ABZX92_29735 [Lentzea sp. NPDC006480]|uniref:hypothetical protein n=1 Tax=Lentzea sp. NPDC006480 TaxID=3157176 RepID=UPI0033B00169
MFTLLSYGLLGIASGPLVVLISFSITRREPVSRRLFDSIGWTTSLAASVFLGSALTYAAQAVPRSAALVAWLVIVGLALALVDWTCQRLPHILVGALFLGFLVQLGFMALVSRDVDPLLRAGCAAAVTFAVGLLLYLVLGPELGFGDVTLTTSLALVLGWHGWSFVALGLTSGLIAAGAGTRALLVMRRIGRRDSIALGPALLLGAIFSILQA